MALDNDGYDNILDPNTMESLPKLSGFGSGNLSGSNLYIPVYNSITQEYQKVTVQDVQPDYSGVKNSLLADAITTQASPAIVINYVTNPNIIANPSINLSLSSGTGTNNTHAGNYFPYVGVWDCWYAGCSAGTWTISYTKGTSYTSPSDTTSDTLCDGTGSYLVRMPDSSTTAKTGIATPIASENTSQLRGRSCSISFTAKSTSASQQVWVGLVSQASPYDSGTVVPVTYNATNTPPTAAAGYTLLASKTTTIAATNTWERITLENISIPNSNTQVLYVVIVANTTFSGTCPIWVSGICLNKGAKAVVYTGNAQTEYRNVQNEVWKCGQNYDMINTAIPMGCWTTTTNFRTVIPREYRGRTSSLTTGFVGTISNVGVQEPNGTFRAASAWTMKTWGSGIELNITTAASTANLPGFVSTKDISTFWQANYWWVRHNTV